MTAAGWLRRVRLVIPLSTAFLVLASPAPSKATSASQQVGTASRVRGTVLEHETGTPLAGVTASLAWASAEGVDPLIRVSDADGAFSFERVEPGSYTLSVTRIGYHEFSDTLDVEPDAEIRIVVGLSPSPIELEAVVVVVRRSPMMAGFEARRRRAAGTIITREEIEQANPVHVSDLMRSVPGATFVRRRMGNLELRFRDGCRPTVWVNGSRAIDTTASEIGIDQLISPFEVEALEVYRGAGEVPAQFGPESCGAIVVWTRQTPPEAVQRSTWKRLLVAAGIVVGILLAR